MEAGSITIIHINWNKTLRQFHTNSNIRNNTFSYRYKVIEVNVKTFI